MRISKTSHHTTPNAWGRLEVKGGVCALGGGARGEPKNYNGPESLYCLPAFFFKYNNWECK